MESNDSKVLKISDLIAHLERIKEQHGDLNLYKFSVNGACIKVPYFRGTSFLKILGPKKYKQRLWEPAFDTEESKGDKVLVIP